MVKDRRKEIGPSFLAVMVRQLGICREDIQGSRKPHDNMVDEIDVSRPVRLETRDGGVVMGVIPRHPGGADERHHGAGGTGGSRGCLIAALDGYIEGCRDIPRPSPGRRRPLVALLALAAAKIALYRAMRECGLGNAALAKRLGTVEGTVRRLLDLDHRSHIGQVEAALHALGQRLVVATPRG